MAKKWLLCIVCLVALTLLPACGAVNPAPDEDQVVNLPQNTGANAGNNAANLDSSAGEPAQEPEIAENDSPVETEEDGFSPLPAGSQPVEFSAADGRTLEGLYYPAEGADAPMVVLMHWAPGSMEDWEQIAPWMQNRGGGGADWFPQMPAEVSFAVVTFNFGGYGNSEDGGSRQSYLDDALAALNYAASLDEVDAHRIAAIGASIGADGAVDSCYLFNDAGERGTCIGALSLSPGNYLTDDFTYGSAAEMVDLAGYPVWCFAAENDYSSPDLCRALAGDFSQAFIYQGGDHGMQLVSDEDFPSEPALDFNTMELIQEFLETAYGIPLNDFDLP
jgi:dienelactone hydrolase